MIKTYIYTNKFATHNKYALGLLARGAGTLLRNPGKTALGLGGLLLGAGSFLDTKGSKDLKGLNRGLYNLQSNLNSGFKEQRDYVKNHLKDDFTKWINRVGGLKNKYIMPIWNDMQNEGKSIYYAAKGDSEKSKEHSAKIGDYTGIPGHGNKPTTSGTSSKKDWTESDLNKAISMQKAINNESNPAEKKRLRDNLNTLLSQYKPL